MLIFHSVFTGCENGQLKTVTICQCGQMAKKPKGLKEYTVDHPTDTTPPIIWVHKHMLPKESKLNWITFSVMCPIWAQYQQIKVLKINLDPDPFLKDRATQWADIAGPPLIPMYLSGTNKTAFNHIAKYKVFPESIAATCWLVILPHVRKTDGKPLNKILILSDVYIKSMMQEGNGPHPSVSPFMKISLFPKCTVHTTRQLVMMGTTLSQAWTSQFATHAAMGACKAFEKCTDLKISF